MKLVGWLVNCVFYNLEQESDIEMILKYRPNVHIVKIFAEEFPCVKY